MAGQYPYPGDKGLTSEVDLRICDGSIIIEKGMLAFAGLLELEPALSHQYELPKEKSD